MKLCILLLISLCNDLDVLKTTLIIKNIVEITFFIIPIILIVLIMVDIGKNVFSSDNSFNISTSIHRFIAAVITLFIPQILTVVINYVGISFDDYKTCLNITQESFDEKVILAKKECDSKNYNWSDYTYECTAPEDKGSTISKTPSSSSSTSSTSGLKNLVYYNQYDYRDVPFCSGSGKTLQSSGCGSVSLSIITSSFSSSTFEPRYVGNWLCSNGHSGGALPTSFFTSSTVLNHFNISVNVLFDQKGTYQSNSGNTYDANEGNLILSSVKQGKGVILYVPGHYLVVGPNESCSTEQVYLYDPGNRSYRGCYTMQELFNKTYNYKSRCSNNGNCGWKGAWAYTGK